MPECHRTHARVHYRTRAECSASPRASYTSRTCLTPRRTARRQPADPPPRASDRPARSASAHPRHALGTSHHSGPRRPPPRRATSALRSRRSSTRTTCAPLQRRTAPNTIPPPLRACHWPSPCAASPRSTSLARHRPSGRAGSMSRLLHRPPLDITTRQAPSATFRPPPTPSDPYDAAGAGPALRLSDNASTYAHRHPASPGL
jgi:hypothetical protein